MEHSEGVQALEWRTALIWQRRQCPSVLFLHLLPVDDEDLEDSESPTSTAADSDLPLHKRCIQAMGSGDNAAPSGGFDAMLETGCASLHGLLSPSHSDCEDRARQQVKLLWKAMQGLCSKGAVIQIQGQCVMTKKGNPCFSIKCLRIVRLGPEPCRVAMLADLVRKGFLPASHLLNALPQATADELDHPLSVVIQDKQSEIQEFMRNSVFTAASFGLKGKPSPIPKYSAQELAVLDQGLSSAMEKAVGHDIFFCEDGTWSTNDGSGRLSLGLYEGDLHWADPIHNIPDTADARRLAYAERKKNLQVRYMLSAAKQCIGHDTEGCIVVDVGCGRGYLTFALAQAFNGRCKVIGLDNNHSSLEAARQYAQSANVSNVSFLAADISEVDFEDSLKDASHVIFVALHACGGLTDCILRLSRRFKASCAVCCCCYRTHPALRNPRELWQCSDAPSVSSNGMNDNVAVIARLAEAHQHPQSPRAKLLFNIWRLLADEKLSEREHSGSSVAIHRRLSLFPSSASPHNNVIIIKRPHSD